LSVALIVVSNVNIQLFHMSACTHIENVMSCESVDMCADTYRCKGCMAGVSADMLRKSVVACVQASLVRSML